MYSQYPYDILVMEYMEYEPLTIEHLAQIIRERSVEVSDVWVGVGCTQDYE